MIWLFQALPIEIKAGEVFSKAVGIVSDFAILAPWICRKEIEDGSLIALPLGRKKLSRRWGIIHWRGKRLNLAEETFIGLCESACATLRLNSSSQT